MKKYFHISFKPNAAGLWIPRQVEGEYSSCFPDELKEPDVPRICVSDTLEGCFTAIAPNIINLLGEPLDFTVYSCEGIPAETPESLMARRLVLDAHITKEHWFLKPTQMKEECKITVLHEGWEQYRPFQDYTKAPRWAATKMHITKS